MDPQRHSKCMQEIMSRIKRLKGKEVVEEVQVSVMVFILAPISCVELVYCVEYYLYYRAGAGLEQTCHR